MLARGCNSIVRGGRLAALVGCLSLLAALTATRLHADDAPLYEQEPYDTIKLDEENKGVTLKVFPLELPGRQVPAKPKSYEELEVRLVDRPRNTYRVLWGHIAEVKLFERMVLDEAEQLTEAGKFDEAYPFFEFLEHRYPKMVGLAPSFEKYQFASAAAAFKQQRYEESLGVLWDLFDHDASYKNLAIAIDRVADKLIQRRFDAEDFAAARAILEQVLGRLKDRPHPLTTPWTDRLQTAATARLTQAKADYDARKYPQANRACRQALAAWPDVPEASGLAAAIRVKYPEVIVGVTSLAAGANTGAADSWSARRDARLLSRGILELTRIGPDGNIYTSPLASLNHDKESRHLTLTVKSGLHWSDGVRPLTAADLARSLLAAADPRHPAFRAEWKAIEAGVSVSDVYRLEVDLHEPVARIEPWLNVGVWPQYEPTGGRAGEQAIGGQGIGGLGIVGLGPYRLESATDSEVRFVALPGYFATAASQPREIAERRYADVATALQALRSGEVMVVDRVGPWDAATLAGAKELEIEPYAAASVHLLRLNVRRPMLANPTFRRALAHALDPAAILRDDLSRGKQPPGVQLSDWLVVPPAGSATAGAASVESRFDPAVSKVLAQVALSQAKTAAQFTGAKSPDGLPHLVLAHPADETARVACQALQRQLRSAGFTVVLQESVHEMAGAADADLEYIEWMPLEPAVELGKLFEGSAEGDSAIDQLATARSDAEATVRLRALEQVIRDETLLIPLWRLPIYMAYHHDLQGVGSRPVTLFQNVEQWRLAPPEASEK